MQDRHPARLHPSSPVKREKRFRPANGKSGKMPVLRLIMAAPSIDIKYVAHLARIHLTPEEESAFGAQLGQVLTYIEKLKEVDVSQVEPTAHAVPMVNVTRPDEVRPSLAHDEAMRNAPAEANGLFMVPKIVE